MGVSDVTGSFKAVRHACCCTLATHCTLHFTDSHPSMLDGLYASKCMPAIMLPPSAANNPALWPAGMQSDSCSLFV